MEFCEQGDMAALIKRCKKSKEYIPVDGVEDPSANDAWTI